MKLFTEKAKDCDHHVVEIVIRCSECSNCVIHQFSRMLLEKAYDSSNVIHSRVDELWKQYQDHIHSEREQNFSEENKKITDESD